MTTEELNALIAQAEGGDVSAMNQVAHVYSDNADFKDSEKAFIWYKKSAELGDVNSMSNLGGWCYLQGNGTEKNIPLADEWLKKAAENGWQWAWAFNQLAHIFGADDENKNYEKAFYWYKKGAEAGDVNCMSNVGGWCYRFGNGTEKNIPLAIKWLEKAAEQNDIWSMNRLTEIYGEEEGFINHEQAAKWFLELIKRDCETERPQTGGMMAPPPPPGMSRVYENTGYNKDLYEKIKNAILNSASENDMSSLSGSSSGGSLFGGAISIASSNAKSYINQAEELLTKKVTAERDKLISLIEKDYRLKEKSPFQEMSGTFMIPEGTKRIGEGVFHDCSGLTSIIIPNSVTSIGENAFDDCNGLSSIIIPDSVTSIGKNAFVGCKSLAGVKLGKGILNIGEDAFRNCNLSMIIIPKGTRKRFENMEGLKGLESKIVEE